MDIATLRAKRATILESMRALTLKAASDNGRDFTAAEQSEFDASKKGVESIEANIDRLEDLEKRLGAGANPVLPDKRGLVERLRARAPLVNFKGEDAQERAERFGHFMLASCFGNRKSMKWCDTNGIDFSAAMSEGVNSAGGFLVPQEFSSEIITLRDSYGVMRRLCRSWPMGRDTITIPRWVSGLTAYAVGEGVAITASDVAIDQLRLTAKKTGVLALFSAELDQDAAVNIGDLLVSEIAYALAKWEDTLGFSGDGTSAHHGIRGLRTIFNAGVGSLAGAVDAASGNDTMAEITAADLARAQGQLPQYVYEQGNPVWICSQTMWANVFERLIGASGGVTKDQASGRTIRQYNGYDVVITPAMLAPAAPTTDASDVAMILFGDLRMAVAFGDRLGMTVSRSTDYKFAEDQVAIKATERFDINVYGTGTTSAAGPIVALMGE